MGMLQKLIAALLAAAMLGSLPLTAMAGVNAAAGCLAVAGAASDDGCCGEAGSMDRGGCSMACAASPAAAVSAASDGLPGIPGHSRIVFLEQAIARGSAPPDTAPPKVDAR